MKQKFNTIDLFKFLMSIVVIAIHTNPFVQCQSVLVNEIAMIIEDMAVPFFFMASGFLLAARWGDTSRQREKSIQKTFVSTVRLYVTWTLLSLPLTLYGYVVSGNSFISCVFSYFKYFLFVGKLYNSYHLWYLLAMIYAFLVMWILTHKGKGTQHILITGVLFYALYLLFAMIRQNDDVNGLLTAASKVFTYVFNNGAVFTGMLYMGIGIYIKEHHKISLWISVLGIAAGVIIRYTLSQEFGTIISSVMFFSFLQNIRLADSRGFVILRNLSKYIYLSHLLCFSFYTFIVIGNPNKLGADSFFVTLILSLAVSVMILLAKNILKGKGHKKNEACSDIT